MSAQRAVALTVAVTVAVAVGSILDVRRVIIGCWAISMMDESWLKPEKSEWRKSEYEAPGESRFFYSQSHAEPG